MLFRYIHIVKKDFNAHLSYMCEELNILIIKNYDLLSTSLQRHSKMRKKYTSSININKQ